MRAAQRFLAVATAAFLLTTAANGYYHFVHYLSRTGPFTPIPEKFDLNTLPNRVVPLVVSGTEGMQFAGNDNVASAINEIRAAAKTWTDVESSDLAIEFAGLTNAGIPQSGAGIEVIFDELPPGVIGYGSPTTKLELASGANGQFIAVQRSTVRLNRDIRTRASYTEGFFLSAVHEIGHALGLQHTFTGGVMATEVTRGVTRARPLNSDDIAGLSILYPVAGFSQQTGVVSGRVTSGTDGVALASVVVISPGGAAYSTLTNPDGTYRVEGVAPGQYFVYAHPLPPAIATQSTPGDVVLPVDLRDVRFDVGTSFDTIFYPGSKEPLVPVSVSAAATTENINFAVTRRTAPAIHSVETYSFQGSVSAKPAQINRNGTRYMAVATGRGLVSNSNPVAGLQVSVMGGAAFLASGGLRAYSPAPASYVQLDFQLSPFADGPGHLIFAANNDIYVLPYGMQVVQRPAPAVTGLQSSFDGAVRTVVVSGTSFGSDTRILFDGIPGTIRQYEEATGRITVVPPPGTLGQRSFVIAVNGDGQSSSFGQSTPAVFTYDGAELSAAAPNTLFVNPSSLSAGTDQMIEVLTSNSNLVDGQVSLGFGSTDVIVRRFWVVGPNRILANITVNPGAAQVWTNLTLSNGVQLITQNAAAQVVPAAIRQQAIVLPILNFSNGSTRNLTPGTVAQFSVNNLTATTPAGMQLTIADRAAQIQSVIGNTITFLVPSGLTIGPAILKLQVGNDALAPVVVQIDLPPAQVASVTASAFTVVDALRPANRGEILTVFLNNAGEVTTSSKVVVNVGGMDHTPLSFLQVGNSLQIQFALSQLVAPGTPSMLVTVDGRVSQAYTLPVR